MVLHYLKDKIKAEPLIWQWYAWPYLIPPMTAACNIVDRHLKIMQSYVQNPHVHSQAAKDPKLLGGPFIDLNGKFIRFEHFSQSLKGKEYMMDSNGKFYFIFK